MRQRLYDDNEHYNEMGLALDKEVGDALRPIFDKYVKAGFSVRDISMVMSGAVSELELLTILEWREVK